MSNQTQVRSWRAGPSVDENSPVTRWTAIILLVAILVGAITVFVRYFQPPPMERMFFSALVVERYDNFIPPLRGTPSDVENLKLTDVEDRLPYSWGNVRELQSEKTISEIGPELEQALKSTRRHDVVLIYVAAHGIGRDNEAFLLGSDYSWQGGDNGLCNVNNVLKAVKDLPCKTKVIFFDCGHIDSDARLGVLVNSFPYCLQQQMEQLDDDSVWAISSTQLLQVSNFTGREFEFKSLFGQAVLSAIDRQSDVSTDGQLTLAELYEHIARYCYTQTNSEPQIRQTPVLLQGGKSIGAIDEAKMIVLGKFLPRTEKKADEADEPAAPASDPNEEGQKTARRTADRAANPLAIALASHWSPSSLAWQDPNPPITPTADTRNPKPANGAGPLAPKNPATNPGNGKPGSGEPGSGEPGSGEPANPLPENPTPPVLPVEEPAAPKPKWEGPEHLEIMFKTWALRDKLQSRKLGNKGWSPVDFAPHIWRALNYRLVLFDRDLRMGNLDREADVERVYARLDALLNAMILNHQVSDPSASSETADARILAAWNAFEKSDDKAHWDDANGRHDATKQRIRKYCDIFYRSLDFVHWYERASVGASSWSPDDINKLLIELKSHEDLFNVKVFPPNMKIGTSPALLPMDNAIVRLGDFDVALRQFVGADLEDGYPLRSSFMAAAFGDTKTLNRDFRIEVLLDSPLLSAEARKYAYRSPGKKLPAVTLNRGEDLSIVRNQPENKGAPDAWSRAKSRLALYGALLNLVEVETSFHSPNSSAHTKDKIEFYETAAATIRKHLGNLPHTVGASPIDTWRAAALLDPRDLNSEDRVAITVLPIELTPPEVHTKLAVKLQSKFELVAVNQKMQLTVEVTASNPVPQTDGLTLKFSQADTTDIDLFEFFTVEYKGQRLTKDSTIEIPFEESQELVFDVQTDHHRTAGDGGAAYFYLNIEVVDLNDSKSDDEVQLLPPLPNFVELFARHSESSELLRNSSSVDPGFGNVISLRPFPIETHTNDYFFWLANRSGKPKRLQVKLFKIQRPQQLPLPPGRVRSYRSQEISPILIQFMKKRIDDGIFVPMAEANLTLGAATEATADYERVRDLDNITSVSTLKFKAPARPAPADPSKSPAPPAADSVDSKNGLVCVVTELEGEGNVEVKSWWKWIEIRPRNPDDYIEIPQATYDPVEGRIEVTIKAKLKDDGSTVIDWGLVNEGVPVEWEVENAEATFESSALKQMLTATQQTVKLFGVLIGKPGPGDVRLVTIPLTLDGYPRTFTLEIECTGDRQQKSIDVTPRRKLVQLDDPQFFDSEGTALDPKAVILYPLNKPREQQALALKECKTIVVSPRIDSPQNSFQYLTPKEGEEEIVDRIEAFLEIRNEKQQVKTTYADREFKNMVAVNKKGGLQIVASVSDPEFSFDAEGLQNTPVDVVTVMHVNGEVFMSRKALLLDSRQPTAGKIYSSSPTNSVEQGTPLELFLDTSDIGTEVTSVVFAYNNDSISNKIYDPTEMLVGTATPVEGSETKWTVTVQTKDLPAASSHRVVARSTDVLGTNNDFHESFLFTVVPSKNAPEMQKKKRFTLVIKLIDPDGSPFRHANKNECAVTITGVAQPPKRDGATFHVSGLPAKKYTINALYITQLKSEYRGLRELDIPPETSDEKPLVVEVMMNKK
ncbi:MAG: hypothetical protein ACI9HK_000221 [Pirellulaceae bacterium]|jgi:hypothetical protein